MYTKIYEDLSDRYMGRRLIYSLIILDAKRFR